MQQERTRPSTTATDTRHSISFHAPMAPIPIRLVPALLLAALIGAGCGTGGSPDTSSRPVPEPPLEDRARALAERAHTHLERGNPSGALSVLDSMSAADRDHPRVHLLRARAYQALRQFTRSDSLMALAAEEDPSLPGLWYQRGHTAFLAGRFEDAVRYYRRSADLRDEKTEDERRSARWRAALFNGLGRAYRELGRSDSARWAFERAVAIDSSFAPAHGRLAQLLQDQGANEEALTAARKAVRHDPGNPTYRYLLGSLLNQTGSPEAAIPHLREVVREQPWHAGAHLALGRALVRTGRTEEGKHLMTRADSLQKQNARIQQLRTAALSHPREPIRWTRLGDAYYQAGRTAEATDAYERAAQLVPGNSQLRNNLAHLYLQNGDTTRAVETYRSILAMDSTFADAWVNLGAIRAMQGDRTAARRHWQRALKHDPQHRRARAYLERF